MGSVHLSPNNPLGSGKTWLEANDFFVLHKCEMLKTSKLWIMKKLNFVNYIWPPPLGPPPSKPHVWYIIRKLLSWTVRIYKKNSNLQKLEFFFQNAVLMLNVCKINVQKMISYTFVKSPWPRQFKYGTNFANFK